MVDWAGIDVPEIERVDEGRRTVLHHLPTGLRLHPKERLHPREDLGRFVLLLPDGSGCEPDMGETWGESPTERAQARHGKVAFLKEMTRAERNAIREAILRQEGYRLRVSDPRPIEGRAPFQWTVALRDAAALLRLCHKEALGPDPKLLPSTITFTEYGFAEPLQATIRNPIWERAQ